MKSQHHSSLTFLRTNAIILIIICVATWLRVWDLNNKAILFSDAGRDLLVAQQSVQQHTVPLLGIPSSVPRFKQGPVSIWIEMIVYSLFGVNTLAQSLTFALISIAAVIGIYEFACIYISKKHALIAAALLATAPLAVASGRVPYHTTTLPLALLLYLFSLMLLWNKHRYGYFLAALSFSFLFQFELAMAPLLLLIPFVMWQNKDRLNRKNCAQLIVGMVLGLLPQIIFDLTHKFAQVGVFILWIGHKIFEFISFQGGGSVNFKNYFSSFAMFGGRIFSTDWWPISILVAVLIVFGFYSAIIQFKHKKLPPAMMLVELSLVLLLAGYFVHGSPSEAYFPPFFVLLPLHCAFAALALQVRWQPYVVSMLALLCIINIVQIVRFNFFVDNTQTFSYGTSVQEMRRALIFMNSKSATGYTLHTFSHTEDKFPTTFDNYRWIAQEMKLSQPASDKKIFFIENYQSAPDTSPFMMRDFSGTKVYWQP